MASTHYLSLIDQELIDFANGKLIYSYAGTVGPGKTISGTSVTDGAAGTSTVKAYQANPTFPASNAGQQILSTQDALTWLAQCTPPWTPVQTGFAGTGAFREWLISASF